MRVKAPKSVSPATIRDLEQTMLFENVAPGVLEKLTTHCRICYIDRRQELCLDRRDGKFLYIIRNGYVTIRSKTSVLQWDNFLAWRRSGQVLGEMEILSNMPAIPIIKATDPCEFLEIPANRFLDAAKIDAFLYRNLAMCIIEKNIQEWQRSEVIQIPLSSAMRRIARTWIYSSNRYRWLYWHAPRDCYGKHG